MSNSKSCKKENLIDPNTGNRTNNKKKGIPATNYFNTMILRAEVLENLLKHQIDSITALTEAELSFPFPLPKNK